MSVGDLVRLLLSLGVFVYLGYALFRGERLMSAMGSARSSSTRSRSSSATPSGSTWRGCTRTASACRAGGRRSAASTGSSATVPDRQQDWKGYAKSALVFMAFFSVVLYLLLRLQGGLPLNPEDIPACSRTSR